MKRASELTNEQLILHEKWMRLALEEAAKAQAKGEVPIGAVLVKGDTVIASSHNERELSKLASAHAEMRVIESGNRELDAWRLEDTTLYVTLEPCPMCAGAILMSRIHRVVYGANDNKAGCAGTLMNLLEDGRFNHVTEVVSGVLEEECATILSLFFQSLRERNKARKRQMQLLSQEKY